jgi:hypothetical protein
VCEREIECVCERERARERESVCVCVRERESARESERERERERLRSTRVSVVEPARWSVASRTPTVLPAVSACAQESKETYYKAKRDLLRSKRALKPTVFPAVSACAQVSKETYCKAKKDLLRSKRDLLEIGIPVSACDADSPITCIVCVCGVRERVVCVFVYVYAMHAPRCC